MTYEMKNKKLSNWVKEVSNLCQPDKVYWCDGSKKEYDNLMSQMVAEGKVIPLKKRPNSFLFRSDPSDVARVEARTFISTKDKEQAGPTNNWINIDELKTTMTASYKGCMKGRTLYVIPFSMGPVGSPWSKLSAQITDSLYVVCNMHIMTRVGGKVIDLLNEGQDFIKCLHSVGAPLEKGQKDVAWPCAPIEKKYISHFPDENTIWSYGSGYGGNALLGKKCLALRIGSALAQREGWMAEHMIILRLTNPEGRQYHIAAAFPSASGKTNLAMIQPTIPGWKAECLGDDIAWMKIAPDGHLHAINPESGFFGVAPGTSYKSNPMAMETIKKNTIFTNCALTDDGDIWWEGMEGLPAHTIDWKGRDWTPSSKELAAHANSRFTAPAAQCPIISPDWEKPEGVPIDIFIFGGRRSSVVPLVMESFNWDHGVFLGATAASEPTAAILDDVGIRYDPFAMLPFCGYNMSDYFQHWFDMGDKLNNKAPRIFYVNWFRKSKDGKWLWPGFGENSRALKWMCERVDGKIGASKTPIGYLPNGDDMDFSGLDIPQENVRELFRVDTELWKLEITKMEKFFSQFGDRLPKRLRNQFDELKNRLG
ncbi:MAG: phosphoenolpyruvate carboxykinase (GTP) [Dehalococcoidales bacterium]|nr:phosphoenolpyruvate carboxykinase (GTP) [Dehalococcoidales bacterium]